MKKKLKQPDSDDIYILLVLIVFNFFHTTQDKNYNNQIINYICLKLDCNWYE